MKREKVESLEDARNRVDAIDDALIELIATRQFYVDQVIRFKRKSEDIKSPRIEEVIEKVCVQASEQGLDPELIENIYREMIQHFIRRELKEIRP
ncbi:chorismate mutase [Acinetobacter faecalis]|uniref:chorismate mutase n=1 Tax=Acinetobacter faecalis TaxID=2665161 RepID=UPI002A91A5C1|nr:chorismate mutase [Acinetobacter faecalis]MDY6451245.1 chorismate mutase [Acinetobacter faecalis]MDY6482969.1 chorismate mutase [Acinetobacter faecalis]MDY6484072.1 chorismate mutase [Acinetobacter faecalis]MDY6488840.1 chorismate mutase [Acinetobacter faecalis]MDY6511799.1 chorismate mutase [Acinetobacter faecalis]